MAPYSIVPPHVLLAGIGVALVDVGTDVLIVPLFVGVVTVNVYVPISSVPPLVVVKFVVEIIPAAVSVADVLLKVRVPYVPAGTYWAPSVLANVTAPVVPVQVFPVGIAMLVPLEYDVVIVPLLVGVKFPRS